MTTTWNITRFVDEIFREMFVYLKYFDEFCMKAVLTMGKFLMYREIILKAALMAEWTAEKKSAPQSSA